MVENDSAVVQNLLNQLKHLINMAQADFLNNLVTKAKAIKDMEVRLVHVYDYIKSYFLW